MDLFDYVNQQKEKLREAVSRGKAAMEAIEISNEDWAEWAREQIMHLLKIHGCITVDDLRRICKLECKEPKDRRAYGAVLNGLVKAGKIISCGYTKSKVPTSHGRPVLMFRKRLG